MIEFDGVNKAFAGQPAVKDLNLHLREGAFSVLIGTSGSGKSTTLKMINRLVEHDSGTIRFAGQDSGEPVARARRDKRRPRGPGAEDLAPETGLAGGAAQLQHAGDKDV